MGSEVKLTKSGRQIGSSRFPARSARFGSLLAAIFALALAASPSSATAAPDHAWIVMDWASGRVLTAHHQDNRHAPASLTKVMTLYLTFEALDAKRLRLDQRLRVSRHAQRMRPSHLGLRAGQTITVRNAILALVTKSANDVAVVLAEALGGTESRFARLMTAKARKLGMTRTTFRNASGLPARGQLTTARDMAILARSVINDFPHHYHYFSTRYFTYHGRTHANHNKLLWGYPGVDGIKTGYVRASGFNLIASAKDASGRRVIAVVLGGRTGRARDWRMTRLLRASLGKQPAMVAQAKQPRAYRHTQRLGQRRHQLAGLSAYARRRAVASRWGVQVGAYRSYRQARRAVRKATPKAIRVAGRVRPRVTRTRSGRYYRARIGGMSHREAVRACRVLVRVTGHCAIVKPSGRAYRFRRHHARYARR
jgi:D-alanyl-D-alanine carboxypeptidase